MLRLLIVEGNTAAARASHVEMGGAAAHELYARALELCEIAFTHDVVFPADADAVLPHGSSLVGYDGIVWTGSALNVYAGGLAVTRQVELARSCFASRVPQFGSCWGLQIAVAAAGGSVICNPKGREIGIARDIKLTRGGRAHPMYVGKADVFDALAVHKDTIETLPEGAEVLASNDISNVQAASFTYRGGLFWGVQYHPEYHFGEISACMRRYSTALITEGIFADRTAVDKAAADLAAYDAPTGAEVSTGVAPTLRDPRERMREVANWLGMLKSDQIEKQ